MLNDFLGFCCGHVCGKINRARADKSRCEEDDGNETEYDRYRTRNDIGKVECSHEDCEQDADDSVGRSDVLFHNCFLSIDMGWIELCTSTIGMQDVAKRFIVTENRMALNWSYITSRVDKRRIVSVFRASYEGNNTSILATKSGGHIYADF